MPWIARQLNADTEKRMFCVYVADCLGLIVRSAYHADDFRLFSDFLETENGKQETKEQVIEKVLGLLDKAGKEGKVVGSI